MAFVTRLLFVLAAALGVLALPARAEPYWYAYDADDDFPENEGWERWVSDPAPERWLDDGDLVIDSRGLVGSTDDYGISFNSGVDPGPGETFIMSWRLLVEEVTHRDPGVYVHSDEGWSVAFIFDTDSLSSFYEPTVYVDIEPHVYHQYEMRSSDMRNYELHIDNDLAIEGVFFEGFFPLGVGFGDITSSTSLASWDYFRFGVVPEPATIGVFLAGLLACALRTARSSMRQVVLLPLLACTLSASATAEPYWIAYEGSDFPENEGWDRYVTDPPAVRWLEDGSLYMDTRADTHTTESYAISFDGDLDPELGETFVLSWRLKVEDSHLRDSGVVVRSDDHWAVTFLFDENTLSSFYEPTVYVDLEPYVYHEFELRSSDMRAYQLSIDGDLAIEGVFFGFIREFRETRL